MVIFIIFPICAFSQGYLEVVANKTTICAGEEVFLSALYRSDSTLLVVGFDSSMVGPGATSSGGVLFTNPCDSTTYQFGHNCWFGYNSTLPREITTKSIYAPNGVTISFMCRYGADENTVDCEDPDMTNEGIYLQYSLPPFNTWTDLKNWPANMTSTGPIYTWSAHTGLIPAGAISDSVKIRWAQIYTSGPGYDNWGIDEIIINSNNASLFSWSNGINTNEPQAVYPTHDSTFIVVVTDAASGLTLSDTIEIEVINDANEIFASSCDSYIAPDNNVLTSSGTYTYTIPTAFGCDSVVVLHLTINNTPSNVIQSDSVTLIAQQNCLYQWVECPTFNIIPSETNQSFSPSQSGYFACIISQHNCTDTSDCYPVYPVEIIENSFSGGISVFPNPTDGKITIHFSHTAETPEVTIFDAYGKVVSRKLFPETNIIEDEIFGNPGTYFVQVISGENIAIFKLLKKQD
ncbi:MAG: hypothetical protein A2W93_00940 [Bacteroidetes bacterium GWF2_43_63]|nr:MAG: hypothetical protein A2W93_00940 [Bacteroidetes bacterium GWF2_43_63]